VFYHEGYRSELLQEGILKIKGDYGLDGEGEGILEFDFMVDEVCPVHMNSPITLHAYGKLEPKPNCTFEFSVWSETQHGTVWSDCTPEYDLPPNMFDVLFADFDQPMDPVRGKLADLKTGISRKEPGGLLEWTANYKLHKFHGIDPYGCYAQYDP
jgi:hypothetical protein